MKNRALDIVKRLFILLFLTTCAVVVIALFYNKDDQSTPRIITRSTIESRLNVHGSPEQSLRICGETFRHLRGVPPYYLGVSNTDLILFAYGATRETSMLVICNTNDCTIREAPLGRSIFGDQIGYWIPNKGVMGDMIESVSSNQVFLLSKRLRSMERSVLNLDTSTLRIIETQDDRVPLRIDIGTNLPR